MGYFADSDEVYRYIGRLFEQIVADPDLGPQFQRADTIVQYRFTEPDAQVTVRMKQDQERRVDLGDTELDPEVVMSMNADTAHRFWLGGVSITVAMTRGEIKARGPVAKILKLVPLVKPVFPRYRAMLEEAGREDLVGAVG
jgi:SCP-2 sterol transfer family protein